MPSFLQDFVNKRQPIPAGTGVAGGPITFEFNALQGKLGSKFKAAYGFYLDLNTAIKQQTSASAIGSMDLPLLMPQVTLFRNENDSILSLDGISIYGLMAATNSGLPRQQLPPSIAVQSGTGTTTTALHWRLFFFWENPENFDRADNVWPLGMFERGRLEVTFGDPAIQWAAGLELDSTATNNVDMTWLYGLRDRCPLGSKLRYSLIKDATTTTKLGLQIRGGNTIFLISAAEAFSGSSSLAIGGFDNETKYTQIDSIQGGQPLKFPANSPQIYNETFAARSIGDNFNPNNLITNNAITILQAPGRFGKATDEAFRTSQDYKLDLTVGSSALSRGHKLILVTAEEPSPIDLRDAQIVAGLDPAKGLKSKRKLTSGTKLPGEPTRVALLPTEIVKAT